jgi:2-keto-3-deoxy-L-fuconate dehydrogenase
MSSTPPSGRLKDKRIVITGAGHDIGRGVAERFHDEGAKVVAIHSHKENFTEINGVEHHWVDLSDSDALQDIAKQTTHVNAILTCSNHIELGTLLACDMTQWDASFEHIVRSAFQAIHAFLPTLIFSGGGSITNVSSIAGHVVGIENRCAFNAAKAALIGLTRSIAVDYASHGVRCNAICTGIIDSPSLQARLKSTGDYQGALDAVLSRQALGRLGTLNEVAHLAVYLASEESSFTTAQTHIIDGGYFQTQ